MLTRSRSPNLPSSIHARRPGGRGHEAVVQIDAEAQPHLLRLAHHLPRSNDIVGDGLLAQHVLSRLEAGHGGEEVISAVFDAPRRHAHRVELLVGQHFLQVSIGRCAVELCRRLRPFRDQIADRHQGGPVALVVDLGVIVADGAHSHDCYFQHGDLHWSSGFCTALRWNIRLRHPPVTCPSPLLYSHASLA